MAQQQRLIERLLPHARKQLEVQLRERRSKLWGPNDAIQLRIRKYKFGGQETVGLLRQNYHHIQLYSKVLGCKVPLDMSRDTLRHIESLGGLDQYLLSTRHADLHSSVAADLKWRITSLVAEQKYQAQQEAPQELPSPPSSSSAESTDRHPRAAAPAASARSSPEAAGGSPARRAAAGSRGAAEQAGRGALAGQAQLGARGLATSAAWHSWRDAAGLAGHPP